MSKTWLTESLEDLFQWVKVHWTSVYFSHFQNVSLLLKAALTKKTFGGECVWVGTIWEHRENISLARPTTNFGDLAKVFLAITFVQISASAKVNHCDDAVVRGCDAVWCNRRGPKTCQQVSSTLFVKFCALKGFAIGSRIKLYIYSHNWNNASKFEIGRNIDIRINISFDAPSILPWVSFWHSKAVFLIPLELSHFSTLFHLCFLSL